MNRSTAFNFNKEIIFGEFGALLVANVLATIISRVTVNSSIISASAVVGTLIGGALFWLAMRIYHRHKANILHRKEIQSDIHYFTPAAILGGLFIYDPALYFISNYLLNSEHAVTLSVITGQVIAFLLFLGFMNIYRIILLKFKLKQL